MTTKQAATHTQRGGGVRTAFNRQALIDQLTRSDGGLEDILVKSPRDLTEAEIRQIAERRLALPAGTEKETLDRFERAFYDDAYGTDPADADETGRLMAPVARRPVNAAPVPARTIDGMDLSRAVGRLADRVADIAETHGARGAVRFLQRGLSILNQAVTEAGTVGSSIDAAPSRTPMFQDLIDDGEPGPKTRAALRTAAARLGSAKVEEALALGRFEATLHDFAGGTSPEGLRTATSASFAELFRDPAALDAQTPTEEGESLQMSVNDLGKVLLGPRSFTALREDGLIGPKTEAALMRVLKAAGPRRLTESMGRNLGFFLFEPPKPGRRSLLQSAAALPDRNFDII
jgi:peptidoglycan hydrolase-like protein with peptidoglycan-binding domain